MPRTIRIASLLTFAIRTRQALAALPLDTIELPAGFTIELVTDRVFNAREMALGPYEAGRGKLFVGSQASGNVHAVTLDQGHATDVKTITSGLKQPVGVAYKNGSLFVSAISRSMARRPASRRSSLKAGCAATSRRGDVRQTCGRCPTDPCSCPMISPARSIAFATSRIDEDQHA